MGPTDSSPSPDSVHLQQVPVRLEYPVVFQRDCLRPGNPALRWAIARDGRATPHRVLALVDAGVLAFWPQLGEDLKGYFAAHGAALELLGDIVAVPGGEQAKSSDTLIASLHREMLARGLDRHCAALIFGGGAVLDAAGYAAATFHRGLRVVRVPTTVLAQNDAGVGVKNGVNACGIKNLVGTFHAPYAVVCDASFFRTLSVRDVRAGMAEAVKVALVRDAEFFTWLESHVDQLVAREDSVVADSVRRAALLHLQHIATGGDPFETGSARPLDFGHWSAHKLEALSGHALRHGEAVAIGMAIDVRYAERVGVLQSEDAERICGLLARLGFDLSHPALVQREVGELALLRGLEEFREHIGGELTITLVCGLGVAIDVHEIDGPAMEEAILRVHGSWRG